MTDAKYTPRPKQNGTVPYKAFAGLRNDVGPERFGPGDMALAVNVDIDKTGRISRRDGYTQRSTVPASSLWARGSSAMFVSGTNLLRLNADHSTTPLCAVSGGRMDYCAVGDRVYFSDGVGTGVFDNNTVRAWGLTVPALPVPTLVAGTLAPGLYQFTMTCSGADGQESGAARAGVVSVAAGQGINFSVPTTAGVVKNIYLTPPNGDVLYLAVTLPNGTSTYAVSPLAVLGLSLPLITQFLQPPPAGQIVAYYRGRMFVAAGSVLYMSEPYAYEQFDLRNYIDMDANITLVAAMEDKQAVLAGLFVGTEKSMGVLTGTGPEDFQYVAKVDYGAVLGTLDYMDGTLLGDGTAGARQLPVWLSAQGICMGMPQMEIANQTRGRYDQTASTLLATPGAGIFMPPTNRYVASSSAGTIAMRTENRAVSTYTDFSQFNSFVQFNGVFLASSSSGIFELVGNTDDGVQIDASVQFGITDFGSAFIKGLERLYVGYRAAGDMVMEITTDDTLGTEYPLPALASTGLYGNRVMTGKGLRARYWQFGLRNTFGGGFTLNELDAVPIECQRRVRA